MRHHNAKRTLRRGKNQRNALLKSLARSLVLHEGITTTIAKAKELRPFVEKLMTRGLKNDLSAKRLIRERIHGTAALTKLFSEYVPKYKNRKGGYTRITKIGNRKGDGSELARIEFV